MPRSTLPDPRSPALRLPRLVAIPFAAPMLPPRKIVHVDMDAFYAAVEQRDDPALRGRPVVVAWRGARSVVCAASYEARRFGIRSAMPALSAERLCPQAIFVPPDFSRYKAVSAQVREIFARHTTLIEPLSLDEAYLDVSTPLSGLPSATAVAESIRAAIRAELGLSASAGVAPNKFLAKIASDWNKPDGLFVLPPARVSAFLEPLPVERLPGVGRVTQHRLHALGVATVGQLRMLGEARLMHLFGRWGLRLHALSQGIDLQPVQPHRPIAQLSCEDTFAQDLPLSALESKIRELACKTWNAYARERARDASRIARTVTLKLKTASFRVLTRSHSLDHPPGNAQALGEIAWALRQRVPLPEDTRYRLAGVGLSGFTEAAGFALQHRLFEPYSMPQRDEQQGEHGQQQDQSDQNGDAAPQTTAVPEPPP